MQTGQEVAIKIVKKKKNFTTQAQLEIGILESLHRPDHGGKKYIGGYNIFSNNLGQWVEVFTGD